MTQQLVPARGQKVIYDVGANNGDDIAYYLKKCDLVVAIEANQSLCEQIIARYEKEIENGRLVVEHCAIVIDPDQDHIDFYQYPGSSVVSSLLKPSDEGYEVVSVPARTIMALIQKYGEPFYIKIDIEGFDAFVLKDLLKSDCRPPFISAESHTADIFAILLAYGDYSSFQLVEGQEVESLYRDHSIQTQSGKEIYSFPNHSAGPFGEDIKGAWYEPEDFHILLAEKGFGWRDIHATTEIQPGPRRLFRLPPEATLRMKLGRWRRRVRSKFS